MRKQSNHSEPSGWLKADRGELLVYLRGCVEYHEGIVADLESRGKDSSVAKLRLGLAKRKLEKAKGL